MSYRKISWSLEAARCGCRLFQSYWNLTGPLAAVMPRCLSNYRAIQSSQHPITRPRCLYRITMFPTWIKLQCIYILSTSSWMYFLSTLLNWFKVVCQLRYSTTFQKFEIKLRDKTLHCQIVDALRCSYMHAILRVIFGTRHSADSEDGPNG